MATFLTKEQVARLSAQELDAYTRVVLDEARAQRSVLARARNYRGRQIVPAVILMVGLASWWIHAQVGWRPLIAFFASAALFQWHTAGINRRIDALLELIERDVRVENEGADLEFAARVQSEAEQDD